MEDIKIVIKIGREKDNYNRLVLSGKQFDIKILCDLLDFISKTYTDYSYEVWDIGNMCVTATGSNKGKGIPLLDIWDNQ